VSKLSKQVKTELIERAINVLFLEKFKELDKKTSEIISAVFNEYQPFVTAKQKISELSNDEKSTLYFGHKYTAGKISTPSTAAKYVFGGQAIKQSDRAQTYPRTMFGVEMLTYRVNGDNFSADHSELSIGRENQFYADAEKLRDEYKELFSLINDVERVVMTASTAKQLQDLSPALYEMLPKTSASTALIPAESLCRVNELLAGK